MAYLGQRTFASFEKKARGWGDFFEEDESSVFGFKEDKDNYPAEDENTPNELIEVQNLDPNSGVDWDEFMLPLGAPINEDEVDEAQSEFGELPEGVSDVFWGKGTYYNEEVDALYVVAKNYSLARNYIKSIRYGGFYFFIDEKTGETSVIQQRDAVTKYYLKNAVSATEVSHLLIYVRKKGIDFKYDLSQLLEFGLDSQEFRVLVEKVQDELFGTQFKYSVDNGYGLYTPQTKVKLQESISHELKKQDKEQTSEILGPDYEHLPNVAKDKQSVIEQLSSPEASKIYRLQKKYLEWESLYSKSEEPETLQKFLDASKAKYESAAINEFGSVENFENLINNIEIVFQNRALQIANNVLNNTEKLIDFELKGYEDENKLKDLSLKLYPAKAEYETYLHERWEADNWSNVSETMESYSFKGMHNDWDYSAMNFVHNAETEAQKIAERGHPMMAYYTQPSNRSEFGSLLGIIGYSAPGSPRMDYEFNDKGEFVSESQDPFENPYKHHGFMPNLDGNEQTSELANSIWSIQYELNRAGGEIKKGISETRANLKDDPSKVWNLDNVVTVTIDDLQIKEGTLARKLINDRLEDAQRAKLLKDIFFAIAGIGLAILALSGVGTPVAILCGLGSVGISAYQFGGHLEEYYFQKSASKTGLTPETSLSSVEPDEMWMVLDLLGIGIDALAAIKIISKMGKLPSMFKLGGEGADTTTKQQLLNQFEKALHKSVNDTDEVNRLITEFTKKLDDPNHVNAIRNTDFSQTHLKNADRITDAPKVKPKKSDNFDINKLVSEEDFETATKGLDNLPGTILPDEIAKTFKNAIYKNRRLSRNEIFFKYHGVDNLTGKKYSWLTNKKYTSENELREKLAIRDDWGVKINKVTEFDVPAGTWVSEGKAASQGVGYSGGDYQAVITNLPKAWVIKTIKPF